MKSHPKKCNEQTYFQQNLVTLCYIFFKIFKNLRGASYNVILGARIFSTVGIEVEHSVTNLVAVWLEISEKNPDFFFAIQYDRL